MLTLPQNPLSYLIAIIGKNLFGDKRRNKRAIALMEGMLNKQTVIIRQVAADEAQATGYYRLLGNYCVKCDDIKESLYGHCDASVGTRHVLGLHDTTEVNLHKHKGRLKGFDGRLSDNKTLGFMLHPVLVVDPETVAPLGIASVQQWYRNPEAGTKEARNYKAQAIEDKESYKWLRAAETTKQTLTQASSITLIGDRENDIYEYFARVPDARTHLLVRVAQNRRLDEADCDTAKLFDEVAQEQAAGSYTFTLKGDPRKGTITREVTVELRFKQVQLKRPARGVKSDPPSVSLYAIEAREVSKVPEGQSPVLWRLLTTHTVETFMQARQMIFWYSLRWQVEQFFRTLKLEALNLEATELETIEAIYKLTLLALPVALKVMQLTNARSGSEEAVGTVFTEEEQACLASLQPQLEGKTQKQKNPFPASSLAWASWIIGRLGGWKGYASKRPAGVITMYRGLVRFESIFLGWQAGRAYRAQGG